MKMLFDFSRSPKALVLGCIVLMALFSGGTEKGMAQEDPAASAAISSGTTLRGRVSGQDEKGAHVGVIANAVVEFLRADGTPAGKATANETGFYEITNISPGSYTYRVWAPGYTADDAGRGLEIPANSEGLLFDFILTQGELTPPKPGTLSGHAWEEKDGERIPVQGARISVKTEIGNRLLTATTDEKGFYTFTLPSGGWKASAEADGKDILVNPDAAMIEEEAPATLDFIFSPADEPIPPISSKVYVLISAPSGPAEVIPVVRFVNRDTGEITSGKAMPLTESPDTGAGLSGSKLSGALTWHQAEPSEPLVVGTYYAEADREGFPTMKSPEEKVTADQTTWFDIAFVPEKKPGDVDLTDTGKPLMPENPVTDPVMPVTPVTPDQPVIPGQPVMPDQPVIPGQPVMPDQPALTGIRGRVTGQSETGEYLGVVPRATVELINGAGLITAIATTDQTGHYDIASLEAGNWTYRITAANYTPEDAGRGFSLDAGSGVQVYDFILYQNQATPPPTGFVYGTVVQGEGRNRIALPGTMISLRPAGGGSIKTVITDENGAYRLAVPASNWQVSALSPDFKASIYPAIVTVKPGGEEAADFNFVANNTTGVTPIKDVYVMASVETPPGRRAEAPLIDFVSDDGNRRIPAVVTPIEAAGLAAGVGSSSWTWYGAKPSQPLPAGKYRAQGRSEGYVPASTEPKVVSNDASVVFDLALKRMRVDEPVDTTPRPMPIPAPMPEVDVLTSYDGYRINGVTVQLVKKTPATGEGAARTVTLTTNDEGRAKGVLADGEGAYSVMASAEGYRDYLGDVVVSESNRSLDIQMTPHLRAGIIVTNSAGAPLPGVEIRLVDKTRGKSLSEAVQQVSDDQGIGTITLKDGYGVYALIASLDGYLPEARELSLLEDPASPGALWWEEEVTLYKEGEARPVDLTGVLVELSPSHDKAYKDGKKIPNARLTIQAPAGVTLPGILSTPLLTASQGEFAAKALPEGTYTVSISAEGYEDFTGPLTVASGMEPLLLSLKPRNAASDNWIRMILTEGWGDLLPSRQFHESGTKAAPGDSNVDYALGLSALQAKDKATSIPAFALAVGKLSNEKWWDRACEAHLWTLMFHQETTSAVSEIRRLIAGVYGGRAESDESRDTAFLCGVAVGVLKGPWTMEGIGQLDSDITAALKGTHLTSYEAGKQSVAGRYTQLSEAEAKAKKDLADAADGERTRMLADLEKRVQQLRSELDANTAQQQTQTQAFTNYRTTAEGNANTLTTRLTELVAQADTLRTEIAGLQETMNSGMQAQTNQRLEELQGGLTANLAAQEADLQAFTTYRNGAEQAANGYVNRLTQIAAELQQLAADFEKAQASPNPQMAGGGMARLEQIEGELSAAISQASLLTRRLNALQEEAQAQFNTYNTQLQQIVNDQTARQTRVNEINAMPPYCPVCTNFAEKPADCQDCAQLRRDREAEVIRLNQEFAQDQARDQEIRTQIEGVQNNYNAAVATYNEQIAPMQAQEANLREEYNRLAGEANQTPAPNPMLAEIQSRDAALRTEYQETEAKHAALTAEYGQAEADYLARINQLKETEAALRAQMANTPAPAPGGGTEAGLIAEKTAAYTRIQQEYADVEKQLATVQADYLSEGGKHQQEIARLTGLATTLTNQINETVAQMGNLPASGTMPADGETVETRPSMAFATYFDYPLEQRRQELLGWVTRGANLGTPATR